MKKKALSCLFCLFFMASFNQKAQAQNWVGQIFKDSVKEAVLEPTTYAPGALHFTATKLDWDTSQVFFRNGYLEKNPDFTISGKANDLPVSYSVGNRRIVSSSLSVLGLSFANNIGADVSEGILTHFYPKHKRLIKWISQIEKMAAASYFSHIKSTPSFSQWRENKRITIELNLK